MEVLWPAELRDGSIGAICVFKLGENSALEFSPFLRRLPIPVVSRANRKLRRMDVVQLQCSCRVKRKQALRGRNRAEG